MATPPRADTRCGRAAGILAAARASRRLDRSAERKLLSTALSHSMQARSPVFVRRADGTSFAYGLRGWGVDGPQGEVRRAVTPTRARCRRLPERHAVALPGL